MLLLMWLVINGLATVGSQTNGSSGLPGLLGLGGTPENITVRFIDPRTVRIVWSTVWNNIERYDVTYKPTQANFRVVSLVAGNSKSITLRDLKPDTQYQLSVTALVGGKRFKSRPIVFQTAAEPKPPPELPVRKEQEPEPVPTKPTPTKKTEPEVEVVNPDPTAIGSKYTPQMSTTVRGVELGLVLLALVVWIVAIVLFFHRWGKIRMLLPYQPDYKTQQSLKVPGTGSTMVSSCAGNVGTRGPQEGPGCVQHLRWSSRYFDEPSTAKKTNHKWSSKHRLSSAIFPTSNATAAYVKTSVECDSPEVLRHAHSDNGFHRGRRSSEAIPLCQFSQEMDNPDQILTITSHETRPAEERSGRHSRCELSGRASSVHEPSGKQRKYLASLENVSDSLQNLLDCVPLYGARHKKIPQDDAQEPLFIVNNSYFAEDKKKPVIHNFFGPSLSPEETEMYQKLLPQETKPKRYNRMSLKKQKTSLFDDRDSEAYRQVPTVHVNTVDNSDVVVTAVETPKPKRQSLTPAEMKRKTFLRKISLQETYLNYNQDYWLDFEKSARFHKSIDLGCFANEPSVVGLEHEGLKSMQNDMISMISERSVETIESGTRGSLPSQSSTVQRPVEVHQQALQQKKQYMRGNSEPVMRMKKCSCNNCGKDPKQTEVGNKTLTELIADFCNSSDDSHYRWPSESSENFPLFGERNGHIEFEFLNELLDQECCLLISKSDSLENTFVPNGQADCHEQDEDTSVGMFPLAKRFDDSEFCEIKLQRDLDAMKTKTFDFRGGQAFFGETKASTSDESDVFTSELDVERNYHRKDFSVPIVSVSSPSRSNTPEHEE